MDSQRPIYAIGDVHGRADLLRSVAAFVLDDADRRGRRPRFVFLGDIVDRGPHSRICLDIVGRLLAEHPGSRLHLGNHDKWFLDALMGKGGPAGNWLAQGGEETLLSYGAHDLESGRDWILRKHQNHVALLVDASILVDDGSFVFVHAGIDPAHPLSDQDPTDCLWIRNPFLDSVGRLPRPVVHGHTIIRPGLPLVTENRISMDTGAYATGRLSVLVIDPLERTLAFHQTNGRAGAVVPVDPIRRDRGFGTVLDDVAALFERSQPESALR